MRLLLWCAAACSSANGLRYTAVCSTNGLRYTMCSNGLRYSAVLPAPNPRAPSTTARGRIRRLIGRVDKSELGGRVFFAPRETTPHHAKVASRALRGLLSVRIVAADLPSYATRAGVLPSVPDATNLAEAILEHTDWSAALDAWAAFGNVRRACSLALAREGKRRTTAVWAPARLAAAPTRARCCACRRRCATPEPRRAKERPSRFSVTLHEDGRPGRAPGAEAAHGPGCCPARRPSRATCVAQACARIKPGDVVLDPFCGKATFLAEAESCWPGASVLGVAPTRHSVVT